MKITSVRVSLTVIIASIILSGAHSPYPIDGYDSTGIRRLLRLERIADGDIPGSLPVAGALKSIDDIKLSLVSNGRDSVRLPEVDEAFTRRINSIFPNMHDSYSIAVLDITPGREFRYAERKGSVGYQPGSVGKLAVAVGFFAELRRIYPNSFEARQKLMRERMVVGGKWAMTDSHTVPFYDPVTGKYFKRTVQEGDVFSLYEWLDHMMSVSNNGAASIVWREAVLMSAFGKDYPTLTTEQANEYFRSTPKQELSERANAVVNQPLRSLSISEDEWRLGSFFTRGAGSFIPGRGGSIGSARGLMKFLVALESGLVVDRASSLEIKRLMYMTDRRIRYAASPVLASAAVYFKSGSLYSCREEEGYSCGKYKGNKSNFMNSVAIVEHDNGTRYIVVLMSNVLKKNSASDHMYLASKVDKEITQ